MAIFRQGPPNVGVGYGKKSRFSTNISLYLGNDTRQGHKRHYTNSYAIDRLVPFPMILSDPYPTFQGHDIFNGKYFENGTVYTLQI